MAHGKRIGVLTGGGDAPGLNAAVRAVAKTAATTYGWDVVGIERGFEGLLGEPRVRPLGPDDVRGILPRGGSILGCSNRGHFHVVDEGGATVLNEAAFAEGVAACRRLELDALVVLGGDGSHRVAYEFGRLGVPVVGVPKTIDNDLVGTDLTFGFDTALGIATEAIDRLHSTAESHDRVMVVEVMGRRVGWIALMSGVAGGADAILVPEIPFRVERVAAKVADRDRAGRAFSIVVVAEGACPAGGAPVLRELGGADRDERLGGVGERVAAALGAATGKDARAVVLGHLQRGGQPSAFDRLLATELGAAAVHAVARGELGGMVAWRHNAPVVVPLEEVIRRTKRVPVDSPFVRTARDLGVTFGGDGDPTP